MATIDTPFALALNRLLDAEPWARERLAQFAGETVELRAAPLPALRLQIGPEGRVAPAAAAAGFSLTIELAPESAAALLKGEAHFMRAVRVSGNARLAEELRRLARHLRWDFEEELAALVGDVAAHRLAGLVRDFAAWQVDAARRLAEALLDYALEERRWLVPRAEAAAYAAELARLRDGIERLERKVALLD